MSSWPAIQAGLMVPAVLGVLASAIGLVYYLKVVKVMFFDEPADALDGRTGLGSRAIMVPVGRSGAAVHLRQLRRSSMPPMRRRALYSLEKLDPPPGPNGYAKIRLTNGFHQQRTGRRAKAGNRDRVDQRRAPNRRTAAAGAGSGTAAKAISRDSVTAAPGRHRRAIVFCGGLAAAEMAATFRTGRFRSQVKWPNDVLAGGRKLAGILLESGQDPTGKWLVIGIGVNLASFPQGTEFPATSLAQLGVAPPSAEEARTVLAARFAHWYDAWMSEGFETVRAAWLARPGDWANPSARLPNHTHEGVFEGIDASGALLLNEQGRVSAIAAAEVFF